MSDAIPVIELVNVDVTGAELRSDTVMIKNVNWTINAGDYWVVGGLPGTGKTDLLATAAALQRPGAGTLLVFGRELYRLDESEQLRERLRIGMITNAPAGIARPGFALGASSNSVFMIVSLAR